MSIKLNSVNRNSVETAVMWSKRRKYWTRRAWWLMSIKPIFGAGHNLRLFWLWKVHKKSEWILKWHCIDLPSNWVHLFRWMSIMFYIVSTISYTYSVYCCIPSTLAQCTAVAKFLPHFPFRYANKWAIIQYRQCWSVFALLFSIKSIKRKQQFPRCEILL